MQQKSRSARGSSDLHKSLKAEAYSGRRLLAIRTDDPPGAPLPKTLLLDLRDAVTAGWSDLWRDDALRGNRADAFWKWRRVLDSEVCFPGTVEPLASSLVCLASDAGGGALEGLLRVAYGARSVGLPRRSQSRGRPPTRPTVAYVDTLASAPWNRVAVPGRPDRLEGVGRLLLAFAIRLSQESGAGGRIALHSAPSALQWYRECLPGCVVFVDGREFGLDPGSFDPDDPYEPYIEVDVGTADAFLASGCPLPLPDYRLWPGTRLSRGSETCNMAWESLPDPS